MEILEKKKKKTGIFEPVETSSSSSTNKICSLFLGCALPCLKVLTDLTDIISKIKNWTYIPCVRVKSEPDREVTENTLLNLNLGLCIHLISS